MHVCKLCLSLLLVEGESGCKAGWAGRAGRRVPVPHPGEMRWGLVPLVLAEDLGQVRTWEVTYLLCDTETWAVRPFELPHELHKVEKPQPHNFLYTLTELPPPPPPPSFLTMLFHTSLAVGNPPQIRSQVSRTPFTSVEGCQVMQPRTWLFYLGSSHHAYLSLSANFA